MRGALLAEAVSPLGVRLLRLDVDLSQALLVTGDRMGNVLAFHMPPGSLQDDPSGDPVPCCTLCEEINECLPAIPTIICSTFRTPCQTIHGHHITNQAEEIPGVTTVRVLCAGTGCRQLPLVALRKQAHQKLPVSLVSIRPNGVVETASHEGNINHYHYRRPASPAAADACLCAIFGAPARTTAGSGRSVLTAAAGFGCEDGGPGCMDGPDEAHASGNEENGQAGTAACEGSIRAQQHGDAAHAQDAIRTAAEHSTADSPATVARLVTHAAIERLPLEQEGAWVAPMPKQARAPDEEPDQALTLISVERIAGLSVLDSDALLPGPGGTPERILTGFQAGLLSRSSSALKSSENTTVYPSQHFDGKRCIIRCDTNMRQPILTLLQCQEVCIQCKIKMKPIRPPKPDFGYLTSAGGRLGGVQRGRGR